MTEPTVRWQKETDAFLGHIVRIYGLDYERKDYVALITGVDEPNYGYARRFLRHRDGVCEIRVDQLELAVLEVRIAGAREYFRIIDDGLEPPPLEDIRTQVAMWLFANGLSLHPEGEKR